MVCDGLEPTANSDSNGQYNQRERRCYVLVMVAALAAVIFTIFLLLLSKDELADYERPTFKVLVFMSPLI